MVRNYKDVELLERVKSLPSFKSIPKDHWILGVRSKDDEPDHYDDKFYEWEGETNINVLTGTTHPGLTILKNYKKYNSLGSAVVKSDEWYYGLWKFGMHRNKAPGLLQLGSEIKVYRDGDKDNRAEEIGKVYTGWYGINFHTNTYNWSPENLNYTTEDIGAWSAGCQVPNQRRKFAEMMKYYEKVAKNGSQKTVTYCLIKEF